ncbi:MAG: ABC transporter permease [Candidatus Aminicenantales bacterium]
MRITSLAHVTAFFFEIGKRSRKWKLFLGLSLLPVLMAFVVKVLQAFSLGRSVPGLYIFNSIIMAFYLQFLILILSLFIGTSVCSEELENKTLTYLTTRPVAKPEIIIGKYVAYLMFAILMTVVGVVLSFLVLNITDLTDASLYQILIRDMTVLSLGLAAYTAFFTFIGTFLKKSILFGLVFSFGWENVIQYFPGSTQKFAIAHYLKSLLPSEPTGRFSFLLFRLEPTSKGTAVVMLVFLTAVFLTLACLIFTGKEYILEE